MDERTHPNCDQCQATVPWSLAHFHKLWHESQTGHLPQVFGDQHVAPEITQLLQVVAALRAVSPVTARTEFVKDLRERLVAEALNRASRTLSSVTGCVDDA